MRQWWRRSQMYPITPTWPKRGSASAWSRWAEAAKTSTVWTLHLWICSSAGPRAPENTSSGLIWASFAVADEVHTRCYRRVFRGAPERPEERQYPARPGRGLHPEPGIREGWGAGWSSETSENCNATANDTRSWSDKIFVYSSACLRSHDNVSLSFQLWRTTRRRWTLTTSRNWKTAWSERRSCWKSPRRGTTTRSSASAGKRRERVLSGQQCGVLVAPGRPLWIHQSGVPTSRRSSRLTGSWRSSGTRTTSSPRWRKRRRRRSLLTSPQLKRSWPTQVSISLLSLFVNVLLCFSVSPFSFQKWDRSSMLARIRWTQRTSREGEDGNNRGLSTLTPSSLAAASTSNSSTTKTRGRPCPHTHTPGGRWGGGEHPPSLPPSRSDLDLVWPTTWRWREVKDDNRERICVVAEWRETLLWDGNSKLHKLNSWDLNFLLICLFRSFGRGTFLSVAQDCNEFF